MGQGDDTAETPGPALEPDSDVGEDHEQGDDDGDDSIALHVVRDGRADLIGRNDTVRVVEGGGELGEGHVLVREERTEGLVNLVLNLGVNLGGLILDLVGRGDLHLGSTTELLDFDGTGIEHSLDSAADSLSGLRLVEADDVGTAALEINTVGKALKADRSNRDDDQRAGDHVGVLAGTQEVDVGVLQEVLAPVVLEGDVLALGDAVVDDEAGDEDGGQDGGDDTDDQGRSEALDRTGTEDEEDDTGQFFLDTLIDDNVGIHRHTQGQDETGDTRKGKDGAEGDKGTEEEEHVAKEGDISNKTRTLVEDYHVDEHQQESDQEGNHTRLDGTGTEGRADDLLLNDLGRSRKFT